MKQFLFFILVIGSLVSCAPDNISRQVIVPASIETIQTPNSEFEIVTSLLLVEDSVLTWTGCYNERVLSNSGVDEKQATYYDKWVCPTPYKYFKLYKGVLITEDQSIVEVGFLSDRLLLYSDLEQNQHGTFIKVKALNNIQVKNVPGYSLTKIFIHEN